MPLRPSPVFPHQPTPGWLQHWSRSRVPALLGPRPAPPSPHSSGQTRPSYKSRLRARGPGHLEQLCRGDCTVRPARPAPTGARRHQQSQHCDFGPYVGYGCVLGLSPQVGKRNAGWCGLELGHRWPGKEGLGRGAFAVVSLEGSNSSEQTWPPVTAGTGDGSHFGSGIFSLELGHKSG